jgi:hypothetical protein
MVGKSIVSGLFVAALALGARRADAAVYYVAVAGDDTAPGTLEKPFASVQRGQEAAAPGDTVFIRGGTYKIAKGGKLGAGLYLTKSGTSETKRICYWAYKNEKPIFDFSGLEMDPLVTGAGIWIDGGDWLYLKGLEIRNVPMPGHRSNHGIWGNPTSNTIFENLNSHHNNGAGLFLAYGNGGNLILNCDAHDNYDAGSDQGDGQNADGFGVHYQKSGPPTIVRGCRAWWNSDDGFDCINQGVAVIIEDSWNALNGYKPGTMTSAPDGNGNGFKIGGWGMPPAKYPDPIPQHTIRRCLAFMNKAAGIYQNHQPIANFYYNNTSYANHGAAFNMLGYDLAKAADAGMGIYRNNVAFQGTATSNATGADAAFNSWSISGLTVAASDFLSVDTAGVLGPRKPDGSLPDVDFLKPSANSRLLNKGKDVGLPFTGSAPDLGAFEYGATSGIPFRPETRAEAAGPGQAGTGRAADALGRKRAVGAGRVFLRPVPRAKRP